MTAALASSPPATSSWVLARSQFPMMQSNWNRNVRSFTLLGSARTSSLSFASAPSRSFPRRSSTAFIFGDSKLPGLFNCECVVVEHSAPRLNYRGLYQTSRLFLGSIRNLQCPVVKGDLFLGSG